MFDLQIPPDPAQEPPLATLEAPAWDLTVGLISATVQLDQRNGEGATRRVGTGFLIDAPRPDGSPRTVLVTASTGVCCSCASVAAGAVICPPCLPRGRSRR